MGFIALIGFWIAVIRTWIMHGPKYPAIFIIAWFIALKVCGEFEGGGYVFISIEAVMAVVLILLERAKTLVGN